MDWFKTLTIINSALLIVFLLLSIFALIKALRVISKLDKMGQKAEKIADSADAFVSTLQSSAALGLFSKIASTVYKNYKSKNKKS